MKPTIKKWLDKNVAEYEVKPSAEGGEIVFIPRGAASRKVEEYFHRFHPEVRVQWRANYEVLAVIL